jgi:DNA repair and recombination protein RAD52
MFTNQQKELLEAPLSRDVVKTRAQAGRSVSYVENWHVINEANRIFGFDGWSSETVEVHCVAERERLIGENKRPGFGVSYVARVRVTVGEISRDGYGAGHGIDLDMGQAHESAVKEAESDAQKRALRMFGNQFGLALYDKTQANVVDEAEASRQQYIEQCKAKIAAFEDGDRDAILKWWFTEEKARQDFDLGPADVIALKNLASAKSHLPKRSE